MRKDVIVFTLEEQRYALPIQVVERVIRAVEVTPLPRTSPFLLGVINIQGDIVPVVSLRRLFRLREREIVPDDEFLVVKTRQRRMVFAADSGTGVLDHAEPDSAAVERILPGAEFVEGMVRTREGLIPMVNPELVPPVTGERKLEEALASSVVP